ncbi:acyl-CoA dehydrogenase family protein [Streptomyces sp. NPDC051452]|uniref:acyl-CoA dehydrogenase family protein n=1 Tax=Streptomyces sp. NPDC051452 TaxID=3365654 RepID=UPI00378D6871
MTPIHPDDVLKRATEAGEALAPLAADVDAGRVDLDRPYAVLRESGLLGALVPRDAGGLGLSFGEYWKMLATLGSYNGAAAVGFNMHHVVLGALADSAGTPLPPAAEKFRTWMQNEVVHGRKLFASATSETGRGARLRGMTTRYRLADDGEHYVLDGAKSFVSLAGVADYYVVAAAAEGREDTAEVSHFVVAADDPGVTFGQVHSLSAMYGTSTAPMTLTDVVLPRSRLYLGVEGMSLFKVVREPHWMVAGYTAAYLGIAEAIFEYTVRCVTATPSRAESPVVQQELGRMSARLRAARALVHEAGDAVDRERGSLEANALVHAAKYLVGEFGPQLAQDATRLCGSAAVSRSQPLERLIREASFASVMPAKPHDCLEYLGKAAVGVNLYDARAFAW